MTTPALISTIMTNAEKIVAVASAEVGVRESKKNGGAEIEGYQRATWLPPGSWPWCAAFVCWVLSRALPGHPELPRTAGAWDFEKWCRGVGNWARLRKPHQGDIKAGDIVIFSFSHIGIAAGAPDPLGDVPTIEGNTNGAGSREGDGVYRKMRPISKIRSRIRIY
jgi:hypothetical protein